MGGSFGAFGKIPGVGDFLRFGLGASFVRTWDDWVQRTMLTLAEALGQGWDAAYMSAPIWRFSLPPGQAGDQGACGILMPSVDRVGRRYPLTLVAEHMVQSPALVHAANQTNFERLERIALTMLEDDSSKAELEAELEALTLDRPLPGAPVSLPYHDTIPLDQRAMAETLERVAGRAAIWSAMGQDDARVFACNALPSGDDARALFDMQGGLWQSRQQGFGT